MANTLNMLSETCICNVRIVIIYYIDFSIKRFYRLLRINLLLSKFYNNKKINKYLYHYWVRLWIFLKVLIAKVFIVVRNERWLKTLNWASVDSLQWFQKEESEGGPLETPLERLNMLWTWSSSINAWRIFCAYKRTITASGSTTHIIGLNYTLNWRDRNMTVY